MRLWSRCSSWWRATWRRSGMETEMDAELRFHLESFMEDLMREGVPRREAIRRARLEFGGFEGVKEECREARGANLIDALARDLRFGARMLRKNPSFALIVVVILGLGIGASTALFSVADACLRKGGDWYRGGAVIGKQPQRNARVFNFSVPEFVDLSGLPDIFEAVGALRWTNSTLTTGEYPERVGCTHISRSVIAMSSDPMRLGRNFLPEEDRAGGPPVAVLSYEFWERKFAGDPQIVGKTIQLDGQGYTIVGVVAPDNGAFGSSVMVPLQPNLGDSDRSRRNLWVLVQLKRGVSWEQANVRLNALARRTEREYGIAHPEYAGLQLEFWNGYEANTGGIRAPLQILLGAVALVLLICCANVANLVLARATVRKREFAIRVALGASRGRLVRQMLTESVLLALLGGVAGILVSRWCLPFLVHLIPATALTVDPDRIQVHAQTLLVAIGLSTFVGIVLGIAPACQSSSTDSAEALKEGTNKMGGSRRGQLARRMLVVSEMALTLVFLMAAALMIQSYRHLEHIDLGFRPEHVLSLQISLPEAKYPGAVERGAFFEKAVERVGSLPGVDGAAVVTGLPMLDRTVDLATQDFTIAGRPLENGAGLANANYRLVSPGYFDVMGAHLFRGRLFTEEDRAGAPPVAIVNQTMARRYWPKSDPIGQRIHLATLSSDGSPASEPSHDVTIVGVLSDVKQIRAIDAPVRQEFYLPEQQFAGTVRGMTMLVRSAADPAALTSAIRQAVMSIDAEQPIYEVESMEQVVADSFGPKRLATVLLGFFAVVALILSGLGIYAVISYSVSQRTRETGIRRALGAQPGDIRKLILGEGVRLTLMALGIGLLAALVLARLTASLTYGLSNVTLLYEVNPLDPLTFLAVAGLLFVIALLAAYIPARRAMIVDPMVALRYE